MFLSVYWFILVFFFNAAIVLISPENHFDGSYNVSMMQQSAPFLLHFPGAKWLKRGADGSYLHLASRLRKHGTLFHSATRLRGTVGRHAFSFYLLFISW